ncbi:MAG TPA: hypothetical protein VJ204_18295, partial [Solirubrobacterales bacterium]|nr:hypothetical protein [Solirubrobacterales bacterium]
MHEYDTDVQRFAEQLAEDLERSVVVEDRQHALIAHSPQSGEVDSVRARTVITRQTPQEAIEWVTAEGLLSSTVPVRIAANPELGAVSRVATSIRSDGSIIGFLSVLDPAATLPAEGFDRCRDAAEILSVLLQEMWLAREQGNAREGHSVRALLLGDDIAERQSAAKELFGSAEGGASMHFCSIVVKPRREADSASLHRQLAG